MEKSFLYILNNEVLEVTGIFIKANKYNEIPEYDYFEIEKIMYKGVDVSNIIHDIDHEKITQIATEKYK